ncbi:SLBB domain-containing protein [Nitrospirota bacterium]
MFDRNKIILRPLAYVAFCLIMTTFMSLSAMAVEYKVGEGDVLNISVYGHDDLRTIERVSGDGKIIFPLIGQLDVNGMTVAEVSQLIAARLSEGFIISPQVAVFVNEFRSRKAVIIGEIAKPGLHELKGEITLLELISMAGGLTANAGRIATIKRTGEDEKLRTIDVDFRAIMESGDVSLDVPIYDGDSIILNKAGVYYITGEVRNPNAYKLIEGTTLIKAITRAGGFTERASENKVRIIRKHDGEESVIDQVSMDEFVLPEDVIVIPESLF